MIQKNMPDELITPSEAAAIARRIISSGTLYRVKEFLQAWGDKNLNVFAANYLDSMWTLTAIYEFGRIQGIREHREKIRELTAANAVAEALSELTREVRYE